MRTSPPPAADAGRLSTQMYGPVPPHAMSERPANSAIGARRRKIMRRPAYTGFWPRGGPAAPNKRGIFDKVAAAVIRPAYASPQRRDEAEDFRLVRSQRQFVRRTG